MKTAGSTYELSIDFQGSAALKVAVLDFLRASKVDNIVEGFADGIGAPVDDDVDPATLFALETDSSPILVFDAEERVLNALAAALKRRFGTDLPIKLTTLSDESWSQAWELAPNAPRATNRFVILEGDVTNPTDLYPIYLGEGSAFGDGRHATTLAALMALEWVAGTSQPGEMLDVGTGTGVLAIAGAKLGYHPVVATEIDAQALDVARLNAARNGVALELMLGAGLPEGAFGVVVANILAPVLHDLMADLAKRLAPGGHLVLAGFIAKEEAPLLATAAQAGLMLEQGLAVRGWRGLVLCRHGD